MAFEINRFSDTLYRIHGDKGQLIGLITQLDKKSFKVEMMMKIEGVKASLMEAIAYVRGVEVAMRIFKVIPPIKGENNSLL
jgi:hypothetical protein